jgi:hypothetical protein
MWHAWRRGGERCLQGSGWEARRRRRRWDDNIEMDLREIGIDRANWIRLAQEGSSCGLL